VLDGEIAVPEERASHISTNCPSRSVSARTARLFRLRGSIPRKEKATGIFSGGFFVSRSALLVQRVGNVTVSTWLAWPGRRRGFAGEGVPMVEQATRLAGGVTVSVGPQLGFLRPSRLPVCRRTERRAPRRGQGRYWPTLHLVTDGLLKIRPHQSAENAVLFAR
jgi:hypothetical protein